MTGRRVRPYDRDGLLGMASLDVANVDGNIAITKTFETRSFSRSILWS